MTLHLYLAWLYLFCLPAHSTFHEPIVARIKCVPLHNAYAHNDYWQKRPLFDALDNGYTNIEVDIFQVGDEFFVSHFYPLFGTSRTLEKMYLQPLYNHIQQNEGKVYSNYQQPITLMVDIKINGNSTYRSLRRLLEKYKSILTSFDNGVVTERQVTVVISGSKPYEEIRAEKKRFAFIDEDLRVVHRSVDLSTISPVASCKFGALLSWNGEGAMPKTDKEKLSKYVKLAHAQGKKVRLWALPEKQEVWRSLLECGVDLINTDQLILLRNFLLNNSGINTIFSATSPNQTPAEVLVSK